MNGDEDCWFFIRKIIRVTLRAENLVVYIKSCYRLTSGAMRKETRASRKVFATKTVQLAHVVGIEP